MERHAAIAAFVGRRLVRAALVCAAVVVVTFLMVRLVPGDPARKIAGLQADPAAVAQTRHDLGLDQGVAEQFGDYVSGLVRVDLGTSFATGEPVADIIREGAASTLELALCAAAITLIGGIAFGLLAGLWTDGDRRGPHVAVSTAIGIAGSLPQYLVATLLAYVFALELGWLPVAGDRTASALILPTLAIALRPAALVARLVRLDTAAVLRQDYIRSARSKRLPKARIVLLHVLPNVLTSALTLTGVVLASLVGGAVIVEVVFARAGLGAMLVQSVLSSDYPVVQGIALMLGISVVLINVVVDLVLRLANPRLRSEALA